MDQCLENAAKCVTCQHHNDGRVCPVFISFRINEASTQAAQLQAALRAKGVHAHVVCNAGDTKLAFGESWEDTITRAMEKCTMFVVLGSTRTYGAEGTETIDTKKELRYALLSKKEVIVVRMTDRYTESYAQVQLGSQHCMDWAPGTPIPQHVVAYIADRVQRDDTLCGEEAMRG